MRDSIPWFPAIFDFFFDGRAYEWKQLRPAETSLLLMADQREGCTTRRNKFTITIRLSVSLIILFNPHKVCTERCLTLGRMTAVLEPRLSTTSQPNMAELAKACETKTPLGGRLHNSVRKVPQYWLGTKKFETKKTSQPNCPSSVSWSFWKSHAYGVYV